MCKRSDGRARPILILPRDNANLKNYIKLIRNSSKLPSEDLLLEIPGKRISSLEKKVEKDGSVVIHGIGEDAKNIHEAVSEALPILKKKIFRCRRMGKEAKEGTNNLVMYQEARKHKITNNY